MHQTFYIDVDEEISSVVDRLNKSMSEENYFVVPKRALFLQSIVNLKILKREADKAEKHIVIVTQDEIGSSMASRSGIEVRSSAEGLDPAAENEEESEDLGFEDEDESFKPVANLIDTDREKQTRLSGVGSSDFYMQSSPSRNQASLVARKSIASPRQVSVKSGKVTSEDNNTGKPQGSINVDMRKTAMERPSQMGNPRLKPQLSTSKSSLFNQQLDPGKEKSLERIFSKPERQPVQMQHQTVKTKNFFVTFVLICSVLLVGVAGYLIIPSAKIIIAPNILKKRVAADLHGKKDVQADAENIPIRLINKDVDVTFSHDVSGTSSVGGEKAQGTVVIYNEYSASSQTLVATTRLAAPDGKIFRLVKNVVVPGSAMVGDETKPGAIEVEIIADAPGSEYNIEATTFKIPGFADGPKFDKFYAKSSSPTTGGVTEDAQGGAGTVVSQKDIDSAKAKAEAALKDKVSEVISGELQDGEISLLQAQNVVLSKTVAAVKPGAIVSSFDVTATGSFQALVFSEKDAESALQQTIKVGQQATTGKEEIVKMEYGNVDPDFSNTSLELKVYGEVTLTPDIDSEQIKKELLGKKDDQLSSILKKYASIKSANVEFNPAFVSRVPQYAGRVTVQIQTEE